MESLLEKWTNYIGGWKERSFVLKGPLLSYYIPGENLPKGRFFLGICEIDDVNETEFVVDSGTGAPLYLRTSDKNLKKKWIENLKISKVNAEKTLLLAIQGKNGVSNAIEELEKKIEAVVKGYNLKEEGIIEIKNIFTQAKQKPNENTIKNSNATPAPQKSKAKNTRINTEPALVRNNEIFYDIDEDDFIDSPIPQSLDKKPQNFFDPLYDYQRRTALPSKIKKLNYNLWDIFKGAVGKDINRFAVPVFLNEPLSMLEKLCENFQYASVLNSAAVDPNPYMRLAYCACFCIGGFTMNPYRAKKYFNPLLFETYEYIDNKLNYRFFAEQVSHHPAISACYAEGAGWSFFTNNNAIIKFLISGKMEVNNVGRCYVHFDNFNEDIVFNKPLAVVRSLIFGPIKVDMVGEFYVKNTNGDICQMEMIPSTSGVFGNLTGVVKDVRGEIKMKVEGNWLENIKVVDCQTGEKKIIWSLIPSDTEDNYYFQPYSFDLNNLTEEMKKILPRTDSRFRPDLRLMEYQEIEKAGDEKHRLEEKQRAARRKNKELGVTVKPLYFDETYDDLTGELIYRYKGGYFEDRAKKNYSKFPDIF